MQAARSGIYTAHAYQMPCDDDVASKENVQPRESHGENRGSEPKIDDSRVRLMLDEHQLAKITIIGDEDATLIQGERENTLITPSRSVGTRYCRRFVAKRIEVGSNPGVRALIDKESHT